MKNRTTLLLVALFTLLSSSLALSADKESSKQSVESPMYYWEKGNRGEKISTEEFRFLMSELEKKLTDVKIASSKISIWGSNFSYETGKAWEFELQMMNENIERAFKEMTTVKNNPNSMTISLLLYVILTDIKASADSFDRMEQFAKTLNRTHIGLSLWCRAFQKAHLLPLAVAKDKRDGLQIDIMKK